jgi:hypothetical protein
MNGDGTVNRLACRLQLAAALIVAVMISLNGSSAFASNGG